MDPISALMAATSLVGLGMSMFGTAGASGAASQIAQDSSAIGGLDIQVNAQRQQQMVLQSQRSQLTNVRNAQMARSQALAGATNQGAQFGSGLQGGIGQISGEQSTNALANSQNLQIGQNIFGLDNQIDQYRMSIAGSQGQMATDQGMAALGGDIMKGAPAFSSIMGNFFGSGTATPKGGFMNVSGSDNPGQGGG